MAKTKRKEKSLKELTHIRDGLLRQRDRTEDPEKLDRLRHRYYKVLEQIKEKKEKRKMALDLDTPRALLRGRYMKAAAVMEHTGIPIDVETLSTLRDNWSEIQGRLVEKIDTDYRVYEGQTFKRDLWARYLVDNKIPWPRLDSGLLALGDSTFREMARTYPAVAPIRELRVSLSQMRLSDLSIGMDGRNRCLLSAFRARTGRNAPSNSRFIFGPAVWLRGLIQPTPGTALAYVDWGQQEVGIAAALSGDANMQSAYQSGDPYLEFGKQAGVIPPGGTKASHGHLRDQFKACVLAVQYGMGEQSLALRIGQPPARARELLRLHREAYRDFWKWSDSAVNHAMLLGHLYTVFGWTIRVGRNANPRSLLNFPMQANGAEMLRLACCLATERGIRLCAPIHDAVLIEAPIEELEAQVHATQAAMAEASEIVLDGFRLRTDAQIIKWPERYADSRGAKMWDVVQAILSEKTGLAVA